MAIIYGILGLIFMIIIHEFGHFLAARLVGVGVERFSVGFGKVLASYKTKRTEYALSLIPLGGYVKLKGENREGSDLNDVKDAFFAQPVYKRMIIVFAGPFFNILSAVFFIAFAYMIGVPSLSPSIGKVLKNSSAYTAGIRKGDVVLSINKHPIKTWQELSHTIKMYPNKQIIIKLKRNGSVININAEPKGKQIKDLLGYSKYVGILGIVPSGSTIKLRYSPSASLYQGVKKTIYITKITLEGLVRLLERAIPTSNLGGPIMIIDVASKAAQSGLAAFLVFASIISINLGILNLLPIPILDGGHLMFFTIEAIRRKPVSEKVQGIFQNVGLAILLALMLFAFFNDFKRYGVTKYINSKIEHIEKK